MHVSKESHLDWHTSRANTSIFGSSVRQPDHEEYQDNAELPSVDDLEVAAAAAHAAMASPAYLSQVTTQLLPRAAAACQSLQLALRNTKRHDHVLSWRPVHHTTSHRTGLPVESNVIITTLPEPLFCHATGEPVRCGAHRAAPGGGGGGGE
jgi:hypothetical protein